MRIRTGHNTIELDGVEKCFPADDAKLGLALGTIEQMPINGLRHPPVGDASGWYIWCGAELSQSADFFSPLHMSHIAEYLPAVVPFLALPAGYRFLIDGKGHEEVWFDENLLAV